MIRAPFFTSAALLASCVALAAPLLHAQSDTIFDKSYPLNGRPALHVFSDNSSVHAQSCGGCRGIHIHVDTHDSRLSDFNIEQSQNGNAVNFSMKERKMSFWQMHRGRGPEITIELPSDADLNVQTENGAVDVAGIAGNVDLRSENGKVSLNDSRGTLHLSTDNGAIALGRSEGNVTLQAQNGAIAADGRFASLNARSDNGTVRLAVMAGSPLSGGLHVQTDNGSVQVTLPSDLHASIDLRTGEGSVHCGLPLNGESSSDDHHHVQGALNGGGIPVSVRTDNGSITVNAK